MPDKILVVDDSEVNVRLIQRRLEASGYDVITAFDGIQAVHQTFDHMPDLIIMDVIMPGLDGYQACRLIKNDERTAHIPILMLTALAGKGDQYWGAKTGADDYLTKPFDHRELMDKIRALLDRNAGTPQSPYVEVKAGGDDTAVVTKVSALLDKKLKEATIRNDLDEVARIEDDNALAEAILSLMGRVLDFEMAGLLVIHTDTLTLHGSTEKVAASAFVSSLLQKLRRRNIDVDTDNLSVRVIGLDETFHPDVQGGEHGHLEIVPLETKGRMLGIIAIDKGGGSPLGSDDQGTLEIFVSRTPSILDNARLYALERRSAITDGLTGAFNHRYFYARIEEEFSRARRHSSPLSCIMVDIDRFKRINDTYGHLQGDAVLAELSKVLMGYVRREDTVARYGGEEFAILLPGTDSDEAVNIAERLREIVEGHLFPCEGNTVQVTVSLGVSTLREDTGNETELIKAADEALYRAKEEGRNCVRADT